MGKGDKIRGLVTALAAVGVPVSCPVAGLMVVQPPSGIVVP